MSRLTRWLQAREWLAAKRHYSARGEDAIVVAWLETLEFPSQEIRYLDVGAASPYALSNTYLLYRRGGRGVLVEPNPDAAERLRRARPRDTVVAAGAAFDERRSAVLTRMTHNAFSSFSDARARSVVHQSQEWGPGKAEKIVDQIEVPLVPINAIIEEHLEGAAPHFLSIDAEGCDLAILKSLDLQRFAPLIVCVEASDLESFSAVLGDRYRLLGHTPENLMFMFRAPQEWRRHPAG